MTTRRLMTVAIRTELDVVACRQRARQIAALCNFRAQDQVKISTAVSELARNVFEYARAGRVEFAITKDTGPQALVIRIEDKGPGIDDLDLVLSGKYQSTTGMGIGIVGARRLMEQCVITTEKGIGTTVLLKKALPADAPVITPEKIGSFGALLAALPDNVMLSEVQQQNRELTSAMAALQERQDELQAMTEVLESTNRRMAELNARLDEKAVRLEGADRRKDEFLAILSHELRGPLSATGMAAQLLAAAPVTETRAVQLGQLISRQVGHMTRLVEDLLDVSRVSRGLVVLAKEPVDLGSVVHDAVEQVGGFIESKAHKLVVFVPSEPCWISGDRTRLLQVVTNLLSNATRYTPEGGLITVSLTVEESGITLAVKDNGIGLGPDLLPYLFDLYVQAERSADGKNGGLGLGLALVKSLVEAHGGDVSAESSGKGSGSVFTVRLGRQSMSSGPSAFDQA
jgi:signal transduction histidine kinase